MAATNYAAAMEIIQRHPDLNDFIGAREEESVVAAERALSLKFPPLYRRFLRELGCGSFGSSEIYGVCTVNFENSSVPDGIWLTLEERRSAYLPPYFVILAALGDGPYAVLDTRFSYEPDQCPVKAWLRREMDMIASDFGEFLLQQVTRALRD
jgi:antitoxin YobK